MYFYTLVRLYDGNVIHLMKFYSSDIDSLKRHSHFYGEDVVTISRFDEQAGEFIPKFVRLPHSSEWIPARSVNIRKSLTSPLIERNEDADEEEEEDLTPFRIYTREYLVPGMRYTFRGGDICDSFVFDSYNGNEALFEEFVHDQTDGHEESRGEIRFDIYQVSRLIECSEEVPDET